MTSHILHDSDNGGSITVKAGQEIHVFLEENPTTGYLWNVVRPEGDTYLQLQDIGYADEQISFEKDRQVLFGKGRLKQITFMAKNEGQEEIILRLKQPWESNSDQDKVYRVIVNVE